MEELQLQIDAVITLREGYRARLQRGISTMIERENDRQPVVMAFDDKMSLHEIGDLLLLLRSSSVEVIEIIEQWRHYQDDKPIPFLWNGFNYLQQMTEDTSFLHGCAPLEDWLGFTVHRNPFVNPDNLDAMIYRKLGRKCPAALAKKASSPPKEKAKAHIKRKKKATCGNNLSPPSILIRPLASITPTDDPIHGARIEHVAEILLQEESLVGRKWKQKEGQSLDFEEELRPIDQKMMDDEFSWIQNNIQKSKSKSSGKAKRTSTIYEDHHRVRNRLK